MKSCIISPAGPVENMNRILSSNRLPGGGVAKIGRGQAKQRKHLVGLLSYKHDLRGKTKSFLILNSFKIKRNSSLNNKFFIDKACSIKMTGYWLRSSSPFFIDIIMVKNAYTFSGIHLHFQPTS